MKRPYSTPGQKFLVNNPMRNAILRHLAANGPTDFCTLRASGFAENRLSVETLRLKTGKLINIKKEFVGNVTHTTYSLTEAGHKALNKTSLL